MRGNYIGELLHMPEFDVSTIATVDFENYPKNIRSLAVYQRFFPQQLSGGSYGTAQCFGRDLVAGSNEKDLIVHAMIIREREHAAECVLQTLIECPHRLPLILKYFNDIVLNDELPLEDKRDTVLAALDNGGISRKDVQRIVDEYAVGEDRYPEGYISPVCDTSESRSLDANAESVHHMKASYLEQFKEDFSRIKLLMKEASVETKVRLSFMISFLLDMFSY